MIISETPSASGGWSLCAFLKSHPAMTCRPASSDSLAANVLGAVLRHISGARLEVNMLAPMLTRWLPARWQIIALLPALALLAYGCGDTSPPTPPVPTATPTPINPQAILDDCGRAMSELASFRFRIEHDDDGGTPLDQGMTLTEASGSVENPDRLAVDFSGTAGSFAVKGSLIAVGEDVYMTNPLSGEWHAVSSALNPLEFFEPSQGIADILSQVRDATLISHDASEYRIGGKIPASALTPLFGETETQSSVDVTLTIDRANLYLTRARLEGRIPPSEAYGIARTITLSKFNEQLDIAASLPP